MYKNLLVKIGSFFYEMKKKAQEDRARRCRNKSDRGVNKTEKWSNRHFTMT